jgi:hypothetical protein
VACRHRQQELIRYQESEVEHLSGRIQSERKAAEARVEQAQRVAQSQAKVRAGRRSPGLANNPELSCPSYHRLRYLFLFPFDPSLIMPPVRLIMSPVFMVSSLFDPSLIVSPPGGRQEIEELRAKLEGRTLAPEVGVLCMVPCR